MAISPADLAVEIGTTLERAERLLMVVSALVERYAPDAPEKVKDEAAIRSAGYLVEQPSASVRSESTGDLRTSFAASSVSALRHSGALALLSPWKIRRGGVI